MLTVIRNEAPPATPHWFVRELGRRFPDCRLNWSGSCWSISQRVKRIARAGMLNGGPLSFVEEQDIPILTIAGREPDSRDLESLAKMRWEREQRSLVESAKMAMQEDRDRKEKSLDDDLDSLFNDEGGTITQHRRTFA